MTLEQFDGYPRVVGADGFTYIILLELAMHKVLCAREMDVGGGADTVPVVLMEKPA